MQVKTIAVRKPEPPRFRAAGTSTRSPWRRRSLMLLVALGALLFEPPQADQGNLLGEAVAASGTEKPSGQKKDEKIIITPNTPLSDEQLKVLKTLERRKAELDKREEELQRREERIKLAEKQLDTKYNELKNIRDEITRLFQQEEKMRDDQLKKMVTTIFINMKADQAAAVLSSMDSATVLRMMTLVPEKQLSKVMEKMDKTKAAQLSSDFMNYKLKMPKPPQ